MLRGTIAVCPLARRWLASDWWLFAQLNDTFLGGTFLACIFSDLLSFLLLLAFFLSLFRFPRHPGW